MTTPTVPTRWSVSRRRFLQAAASAAFLGGCSKSPGRERVDAPIERMIVLGVDGMDPKLVQQFVGEGKMPNCARLMQQGSFGLLQTCNPPQSPVAWSNFISGTNPGGHGIFDFIARDPKTMRPFHSTAEAVPPSGLLPLGRYQIPLSAGSIENRRQGTTFWNLLSETGIPCTVFRVPANFPTTETDATTISGMGTPDLLGGYGTFTYFTDDSRQWTRDVSGGHIEKVFVRDHVVDCKLKGPVNSFLTEQPHAEIPLRIYLDPERPLAKIVFPDTETLLHEGEWSDWIIVKFPMLPPLVQVSGICRVLLKRARDGFGLYVSPVNIDPADPSLPISTPPDYSRRLVREMGYFYTQGMIEDTSAFSAGVLTPDEYRQQSTYVIEERMRFFEHELARFEDGFLFFYFSSLDLNSHVFWQTRDPGHPTYSQEFADQYGDFIPELYGKIDHAIGQAMERTDERTLLIVMSDHGFTSFRRQFNLNSWLADNGYVRLKNPEKRGANSYLTDVDWPHSKAYGLGINGLYLNLAGREVEGTVQPGTEAEELKSELIARLKDVRDPENGAQVVANVFRAEDIYSGPYLQDAPDLVVAYSQNYRASWDTVLGAFPREHILDNTDAWSGDHCVDSQIVPGVLLSNRAFWKSNPDLTDIAPTILSAFGIPVPEAMTGQDLLRAPV